jgi:hypothetical protein
MGANTEPRASLVRKGRATAKQLSRHQGECRKAPGEARPQGGYFFLAVFGIVVVALAILVMRF